MIDGVKILLAVFILSLSFSGYCQDYRKPGKKANNDFEQAKDFYNSLETNQSIKILQKLVKKYPGFGDAWILLGYNYFDQGKKKEALDALASGFFLDTLLYRSVLPLIAELQFTRGDYEQALYFLNRFYDHQSEDERNNSHKHAMLRKSIEFAVLQMATSNEAKVSMVNGSDSLQNIYFPSLTIDGKSLVYTSLTTNDADVDNSGQEDLFTAVFSGYTVLQSTSLKGIPNTPLNEGTQGIRLDGRLMFITACSYPDSRGGCDIYISSKSGDVWSSPKNLGSNVNSRYWESTPSLSPDGKTLYFASNRPGGYGGMDLWKSSYIPGSGWGPPENLGGIINTSEDELAPYLTNDGERLYFSSSGHIGMGNLDIYFVQLGEEDSLEITNPGYPLNTHHNEFGITMPGSGEYILFSSDRSDLGLRKIYRYDPELDQHPHDVIAAVKGRILDSLSGKGVNADVQIRFLDGKVLQKVSSDKQTGEFLIGLPLADGYIFVCQAPGYFYKELTIDDINFSNEDFVVEILLKPLSPGNSIVLNHIMFEFDSAILRPESTASVLQLSTLMKDNPDIRIEISGHTDSVGVETYNQELSQNRALALKDRLLTDGVSSGRITTVGHGSKRPIASNNTEAGRARNRRIEIKIL